MADEKSKVGKDYERDWIYGHYEDGESVAEMAKILGKSESYVYAQMKKKPQEYEDIKKFLEEKYKRRIRRIRGLADRRIEKFLEGLDDKEASERIETINRISKDSSSRVQLSEGKATENIGVGGMNRPFSVLITKTYASEEKDKGTDD